MLSNAIAALRCPVCHGNCRLSDGDRRSVVCSSGHVFDAAKQGYFNLLTGKGTVFEADTAVMVAARQRFLEGGHYAELTNALAGMASPSLTGPEPLILDAGTGTGHYLHAVLEASPAAAAVGLDISKFALRRAARLNPQAANLVWDIWRPLPLARHSADVVMVVFAPRNAPEFARVLRPGGKLIVVTPRPGHLAEAAERTRMLAIQDDKAERLVESLSGHFRPEGLEELEIPLVLSPSDLADVAVMGPAGHHIDAENLAGSLAETGPVSTVAKFSISLFSPRVSVP